MITPQDVTEARDRLAAAGVIATVMRKRYGVKEFNFLRVTTGRFTTPERIAKVLDPLATKYEPYATLNPKYGDRFYFRIVNQLTDRGPEIPDNGEHGHG